MEILTLTGIAVALAMDAFAVALGVGVCVTPLTHRHYFRLGFHFGLFQALMPILGWLIGRSVQQYIVDYDHWIALILLSLIGGHMIYEALHPDREERKEGDPTRGFSLVLLSIATSIDALAVGLSLAMLGIDVWFPALIIGLVACAFTLVGLRIGRRVGEIWGQRVEIFGGIILILIGIKIVLEHTLS
jgi:putative Mn2+ efflux pump MntP